jgi:5-hydroxyisourate hydrolase-like protein (transthyretin family)
MRMARLSHINEFDSEKETISAYLERVEMFFQANDVKTEKRVPVLLSVIGVKT